jgi:hypothetical protein
MRSLVVVLSVLSLAAPAAAGTSIPPLPPRQPTVAYVTQTATSPALVWAKTIGGEATKLGPGSQPLIAPSGQQVAASLSGTGEPEKGPALAIYWTEPGRPPLTYLDRSKASVYPLAWSRDLRYVAVAVSSASATGSNSGSGLAIVDISLDKVTLIAHGAIYGASFAPSGPDRVVYGRAGSESPFAPVNLYTSNPDGSETRAITRNGRSLFPVWGSRSIAYDRERLRGEDAPQYQIWLHSPTGSGARRLTNVPAGPLVSGLVPIAFAGQRLLAEFVGEDTSEAWTVRLPSGRARRVTVGGNRSVQGAGISGDGSTLLVDVGSFEQPASGGSVDTLPFAGGAPTVVVAHAGEASWGGAGTDH